MRLFDVQWSESRPADTLGWQLVFHHSYTVTLSLPVILNSNVIFPASSNQFGFRCFWRWIALKSGVKSSSPGFSQGYGENKTKHVYHIPRPLQREGRVVPRPEALVLLSKHKRLRLVSVVEIKSKRLPEEG